MQIRIKTSMKNKIANAVGCCVFTALRENDRDAISIRDIDEGCVCYNAVRSAEPSGEIAVFDLNDGYCPTLAGLIEKYLSVAASEQADNDMEWLCEIMSFYHQLKSAERSADVQRDRETEAEMTADRTVSGEELSEEDEEYDEQYYDDVEF